MKKRITPLLVIAAVAMSGCSTTQEVFLAKADPNRKIVTVSQVPSEGISAEMDSHLETALRNEGLSIKSPLPAGTRKSHESDAIVSYVDVWRWDLVMYLKSISIRMFDAQTGDLFVSGQWNDSQFHGFRDAKAVMAGVVSEMVAKLQAATKEE